VVLGEHEADHEIVRGQERRRCSRKTVVRDVEGLFPSSTGSVCFANGSLSLLHPYPRPRCDPFEIFPLSRGLLSLATVPNDSLDLPPWRGIHERVEGEILVDESPAHEGARGLQKIAIVEKCSQPSLPRGNRFSNSSRLS